jgi:geranylgeranyl diphosphate synthase type I
MTTMSGEPPVGLIGRQDELEAALKSLVADRTLPLYRMMDYHMGWSETTGEARISAPPLRVHGALTLLACESLGGNFSDALPHASSVEYLYNHILIHDDVRDGNSERDRRASVWWSWGPAQAINTGDGMHALARLALFEARNSGVTSESVADAIRVLDEANLETCEGQYRDITLQERLDVGVVGFPRGQRTKLNSALKERLDVGVDEYLSMCESQTGALLACAVQLGALASGESDDATATVSVSGALNVFGRKLGTAIRVADDCDLFWPNGERDETRQGRLVAKKKSLPVAHVIADGTPTDRRRIGEIYMERVIDPESAKTLVEILDAAGARKFSTDTITRLLDEAESALIGANLSAVAVQKLTEAARYLATPDGLASTDLVTDGGA